MPGECMNFIGIDLAGNPKNKTGYCLLQISEEKKKASTLLLHSDSEIINRIKKDKAEIIAIDAPLTYTGVNRKCDEELRIYGALPVTLRGMEILAKRGTNLACELKREGYNVIEVYATASTKILGLYDPDEKTMQKKYLEANLSGDLEQRILVKDELDAISCALTAYLHSVGATTYVGEAEQKIIIPKI